MRWRLALVSTRYSKGEFDRRCNNLERAWNDLVEIIEEVDSKDHPRGSELEKILGISETELLNDHDEMLDYLWT